jgi:GNAT superfamily N-acetyltransferase
MKNLSAWFAAPVFVIRNLWCCRHIAAFAPTSFAGFAIRPLSAGEVDAVDDFYAAMAGGKRLGRARRIMLRMLGCRLCLIARDAHGRLAGILVFYFNARDKKEGSVHEAYVGLLEAARGQGLGTFMRRHALRHYAQAGLERVSSRISVNNHISLKANRKLGYESVETYFDSARNAERHYLICKLDRYRTPAEARA